MGSLELNKDNKKMGSPELDKDGKKMGSLELVDNKKMGSLELGEDYYTKPDFIYGGPFIPVKTPSPFWDLGTPMNTPLQGTYKKSFAYFSLKERLPVILTKIIDYLAREGSKIASQNGATAEDVTKFMQTVTKLKNDLVTNKEYDRFTVEHAEAEKWNKWIEALDIKKYFLNSWMFTECYVYRKLREGCELTGLQRFDYFEEQKNKAFDNNVELMCLVANKLVTMITKSEKDKRKADFVTLLKICLWANKCDLSLSLGSEVDLIKAAADETERLRLNPPPPPLPPKGKKAKKKAAAPVGPIIISSDPFQMILDMKDKVLADDCNKIADQVQNKAEKMAEKIAAYKEAAVFKAICSCNKLAKQAGLPICEPPPPLEEDLEDPPPKAPEPAAGTGDDFSKKIPCPAKVTVPSAVFFDIVCDNAGYELFADLCLAHFLVAQKIVEKVRFHVKNMPWFVSDATRKDFSYLIAACSNCQFSAPPSTTGGPVEEGSSEPKVTTAENLRVLGAQWAQYIEEGVFIILSNDFWTYPHCYKDMKKLDNYLYRKLQTGVACMFKGDLNYRKLVGDVNLNPMMKFQAALQEFKPAPIIAVRTVKSETICGLGKGKFDLASNNDPKWMQTGNYGVIQWAPKGEALKVSDKPCIDYCTTCFGVICPEHLDM